MPLAERSAKLLILTMCLLGVLFALALKLYLYSYTWWFDNVLHFLAGMVIAYFYFVFRHYVPFLDKIQNPFLCIIALALVIGIGWEYFEVITGTAGLTSEGYWLDTIADVAEDMTGAMAGYWVIMRKQV